MTLVPVPTKTARSRSDIKGRRPFDVPASNFIVHVNFLQWDVANPRTTSPIFMNMSTTSMVFWLIFESGLHFGILLIYSRCSSRRSSLGHCSQSNLHVWGIQFPSDLYKDPFLSSVCEPPAEM